MTWRRVAVLALLPAAAAADPELVLKLDGGAEADSNVHRVTGGGTEAGADVRAGLRLGLQDRIGERGRYALEVVGAAKVFAGAGAAPEDIGVASAAGRAELAAGALAPGLAASYYESFADTAVNALALRTGSAAGTLALRAAEDVRAGVAAGWRFFRYKFDPAFDFDGPHIGLTVVDRLHGADATRQLALTGAYTASLRRYGSAAIVSYCRPGEPVTPSCLGQAGFDRADLFHDLAVDATYTGDFIAGLRLGLQVNDSNSFGQSIVRGRVELSGTVELFADIVVTARVVLQLDDYVDGLLQGGDIGTFATIEDETRNAVFLHATRDLSDAWTVEASFAAYASAFTSQALAYSRQTAYLGLVYTYR